MRVELLSEKDLLEQADRIVIFGYLRRPFEIEHVIRKSQARELLLVHALVKAMLLLWLDLATDGVVYIVGDRVGLRIAAIDEGFKPASQSVWQLLRFARLLARWLRCREAVTAAPVIPEHDGRAAERATRSRRHLAGLERLIHPMRGPLVKLFESWAHTAARTRVIAFTVAAATGEQVRFEVPPRIRLFAPVALAAGGPVLEGITIESVEQTQRIKTARGRELVLGATASSLTVRVGDRIHYDGVVRKTWLREPASFLAGKRP